MKIKIYLHNLYERAHQDIIIGHDLNIMEHSNESFERNIFKFMNIHKLTHRVTAFGKNNS